MNESINATTSPVCGATAFAVKPAIQLSAAALIRTMSGSSRVLQAARTSGAPTARAGEAGAPIAGHRGEHEG